MAASLRPKQLRKLGFSKRDARAHATAFNLLMGHGLAPEEAAKRAANAVTAAKAAAMKEGKQNLIKRPPPKASQLATTLARGDGVPMVMANDIAQLSQRVSDEETSGGATSGDELRKMALDAGGVPQEIALMMEPGVDPDLRAKYFSDLVSAPIDRNAGPVVVDEDRGRLHVNAKALADARCQANPELDPGDVYMLAAQELADAQALHTNAQALAASRCRVDPQLDADRAYTLARQELTPSF
jgi:hypothetical protein